MSTRASVVEEFAASLRKGRGRAMLILRASPDDPSLLAALLHASTHNVMFDTECEEPRAPPYDADPGTVAPFTGDAGRSPSP